MNTSNSARQRLLGSLLILLGAIGFSAKSIFIKLAYANSAQIDAITLMTLRMLFALPFFLGVAFWHGRTRPATHSRQDWTVLLLLGFMGYYLASLLDFKGLEYISAGLERLILFLYPTFVVLLTALLHKRPVGSIQRMALILSYAGIGLVFGAQSMTETPNMALGASLVFGSALAFAIYMTASGHYIPRFGSRRFTAYSMTVACGITIAHFLASNSLERLMVPPDIMVMAIALALFSTVLPAFLMNAGIQRTGADHAAIIGTAGPVSTLLLAWLILDESMTLAQSFGAALVLCGVLLVSLTNSRTKP